MIHRDPSCIWCGEPVLPDDIPFHLASGQALHLDCLVRSAAGSVAHQQHRCTCYGGTEDDPPGLSMREAARQAADYFRQTHGANHK